MKISVDHDAKLNFAWRNNNYDLHRGDDEERKKIFISIMIISIFYFAHVSRATNNFNLGDYTRRELYQFVFVVPYTLRMR